MHDNTTGSKNIAIGRWALYYNSTNSQNTAIGYRAFSGVSTHTNSTAIGYEAEPNASNTVRLGNSSVSSIGGYANWTNISDGRFKTNIRENVAGLDFILKLRPITYNLNMDAIAGFCNTVDSLRNHETEKLKAEELQTGFVAQEVEAAALAVGYDFHGVDKPKNEDCHYGLRYAEFVVPLVKSVQELANLNDKLVEQIDRQQKIIESLANEIEGMKKE